MKRLKRNGYLQGAFVATFGIVISKILGMLYVIPFYSVIGEQGGALYGYAYNIYSIFLSISTAGIPLAISSIVSEYNTLGYKQAKEKTFKLAKKYLSIIGIISFLVVFIFAKDIAYMIIGNISGGNSIEDIAFAIRTISFSILIVPTLSVYRGYLPGHKYITPTSISQVLEQIIRVSIIIIGSFVAVKVLHLEIKYAVACALVGATIGAFISYTYLVYIKNKYRKQIEYVKEKDTKIISDKTIIKKILLYAFPFIFCDVCKSLYNSVDTFFVVKTLVKLGFDINNAETVMGIISTWGNKLNMIVVAIGTGFCVSLIPNLSSSFAKKDIKDFEKKINTSFQVLAYLVIPMTIGLSFLSAPVWNAFYGASTYGPIVFSFSIMVAIATVFLSSVQIITLSLKEYKILFIAVLSGLAFNAIFDVPLMYLCSKFTYAFYGATLSTILGHILTISIILIHIAKKYKFSFKETYKNIGLSILFTITMWCIMYLMNIFIPLTSSSRITSLLIVLLYAIIGGGCYLILTYKFGLIKSIFGDKIIKKIEKTKNKIINR